MNIGIKCTNCKAWGLLFFRLILGIILIVHGYPKLFGESAELLAFFENTVLPAPSAMLMLAGVIEFFGGALLIVGIWNKVVSYSIAIEFAVIILFVKLSQGFSALELELLVFASLYLLASIGPGNFSLEEVIRKRRINQQGEKGGHGQEAIGG